MTRLSKIGVISYDKLGSRSVKVELQSVFPLLGVGQVKIKLCSDPFQPLVIIVLVHACSESLRDTWEKPGMRTARTKIAVEQVESAPHLLGLNPGHGPKFRPRIYPGMVHNTPAQNLGWYMISRLGIWDST